MVMMRATATGRGGEAVLEHVIENPGRGRGNGLAWERGRAQERHQLEATADVLLSSRRWVLEGTSFPPEYVAAPLL